jgi:L-rhamnose mutarotase
MFQESFRLATGSGNHTWLLKEACSSLSVVLKKKRQIQALVRPIITRSMDQQQVQIMYKHGCRFSELSARIKGHAMQRFGMTIRLTPGSEASYKEYHSAVWKEVLATLTACNIRNYSIFFKDDVLFSYFEYHGADIKADWARMAADPKTQEWWAIMEPLQAPLATRKEGEWWAEMEQVFHLD